MSHQRTEAKDICDNCGIDISYLKVNWDYLNKVEITYCSYCGKIFSEVDYDELPDKK